MLTRSSCCTMAALQPARDPQLLEHMLAELPVTVRLVRVEARQQERAVLPEDAWVVLITLNKRQDAANQMGGYRA